MPDAPSLSGRRVAALAGLALALHGLFDAVTYRIPHAAPPYLRLADAPEVFQFLSPLAVSIAVCCVSGIIAVIAVVAVEPRHRRPLVLGGIVTGFWLFSALLTRVVWMSTPWSSTALALALGVPRGLAIGWLLAIVSRGPTVNASMGARA